MYPPYGSPRLFHHSAVISAQAEIQPLVPVYQTLASHGSSAFAEDDDLDADRAPPFPPLRCHPTPPTIENVG